MQTNFWPGQRTNRFVVVGDICAVVTVLQLQPSWIWTQSIHVLFRGGCLQVRLQGCAFGATLAQCRSRHATHHSGTAATSSEFNAGCSVPPWQTHYAAGGSGGADWFLRWQAFSTFRNQCPIPTAYSNGDCFSAQVDQSRGTAGYVARHFTRGWGCGSTSCQLVS